MRQSDLKVWHSIAGKIATLFGIRAGSRDPRLTLAVRELGPAHIVEYPIARSGLGIDTMQAELLDGDCDSAVIEEIACLECYAFS